jgi:hypothetical protein
MRENICEQIDFILQGGLLEKIAGELEKFTSSALILEIKNEDVIVLEAVNVELDRLMFKDIGRELLSCSPVVPPIQKLYFDNFPIPVIPQLEKWRNVIRFHSKEWDIYILIAEAPSQDLLDALRPYLKVVSYWISLRNSSQLEERLSTLSYMILTTKNTLASVFEPMSIEYYAEFLRDVFKESFFPQKIAVYVDDGFSVKLLKGDNLGTPNRTVFFATVKSFPKPIVYKAEDADKIGLDSQLINGESIIVLPVTHSAASNLNDRLFCIGVWEKHSANEVLNFMELLGNVASKALEMRELRITTEERAKQLDSRSYTIAAFHKVLKELVSYNDRIELFSFFLSFFSELSQAERVKLVVYDSRESKYFLVGESYSGISAQCFDPLTESIKRISGNREGEMNEHGLKLLGFKFTDMPKCKAYPLWVEDKLEGFVAMHNIKCDAEIYDYQIVFMTFCQIVARELHFRLIH